MVVSQVPKVNVVCALQHEHVAWHQDPVCDSATTDTTNSPNTTLVHLRASITRHGEAAQPVAQSHADVIDGIGFWVTASPPV